MEGKTAFGTVIKPPIYHHRYSNYFSPYYPEKPSKLFFIEFIDFILKDSGEF